MNISILISYLEGLREIYGDDIEVKRKNHCGDYGETDNTICQIERFENSYGDEWVILE